MTRTPLVVGNWKMELSHKAEVELARSLKTVLKNVTVTSDVVVCPSFPSLPAVSAALKSSEKLMVGAQTIHAAEKGAWTGAVSVLQIMPFVRWCIVGHSEQRALTHETDAMVQHKVDLLLKHGITPIFCIGESAAERAAEATTQKITNQIQTLLHKAARTTLTKVVIAYEPIWAIGSGQTPDSNEVAATMLLIRKIVAERFDPEIADRLRIIYGGSVSPQNIQQFMAEPGIDGALVGGAALHPLQFVEIIRSVQKS